MIRSLNIIKSISPSLKQVRYHGGSISKDGPQVLLKWLHPDGRITETKSPIGINLMRLAHAYELPLEGACEGVCACSTCHVILEDDIYDSLQDEIEDAEGPNACQEASEEEEDMLDLAFGLTPTSRLGCQVKVRKSMDGMTITLPRATRNFYVVSKKYIYII